MRDLEYLSDDIKRSLQKAIKIAGREIAEKALRQSEVLAPKDTGFMSEQGRAFVDGKQVATGSLPAKGYRRVSMSVSPPEASYSPNMVKIFLAYRAGRPRQDNEPFDYAYYNRYVWGREWIESAINPRNAYFEASLRNAIRKVGLV